MDTIRIKNLAVDCRIGTGLRERKSRQRIIINITLACDLTEAARDDDLAKTVDYGELTGKVLNFIKETEFFLLEALAESIASICLKHPKVKWARIGVAKPRAVRTADYACVEIERSNRADVKGETTEQCE